MNHDYEKRTGMLMVVMVGLFMAMRYTAIAAASEATSVPFQSDRERAVIEPAERIHLGSGFITHAAVTRDWLAVASVRRYKGEVKDPVGQNTAGGNSLYQPPQTRWYAVNAVDVYQVVSNRSLRIMATIPMSYAVQLLKFNEGTLLVGDHIGLSAYQIVPAKGEARLLWKYAAAKLGQVEGLYRGLLLRSPDCVQVLEADGQNCRLKQIQFLPSDLMAGAGLADRYFVIDRAGQCHLYGTDPSGIFRFAMDLPLLGQVRYAAPYGQNRTLVLDRTGQLRLFNTLNLVRDVRKLEDRIMPERLDDPRFPGEDLKAQYVADELALKGAYADCRLQGDQVLLVNGKGQVETVTIDPEKGKFGKILAIPGLTGVASVTGEKDRYAAVGRDGSVSIWSTNQEPVKVITPVETGPWCLLDGRLYVAAGHALHAVERGGLGAIVYQDPAAIADIRVQSNTVYILSEARLAAARLQGERMDVLSSVPVPSQPHILRIGPEYAAVVHGDRGLLLVDIRDPQRLKKSSDRQLEMPTHSEVPTKTHDDKTFEHKIRDVLVESNRLFAVGTEVFLYDLTRLAATDKDVPWLEMWHRPYVSADDITYTRLIARLAANQYLVVADRMGYSRTYVLTLKDNRFDAWRYCRLGAGNALDVQVGDDGLAMMAAGEDGLRLLRFTAGQPDIYLGSRREPGAECQAVLTNQDKVYVKGGNTVWVYKYGIEKAKEQTAYSFAPQGNKLPRLVVNNLNVTSEEYRVKAGYRNRLKLAPTDLSDAAGFPKIEVKQGTVAIDPKLGRIKFADGRNAEPKFLARSEYINVGLSCWRKVGPHYIATMSEQSQGFGVMDLSDPTNMKILAVAGQPNWMTYPHTIIAYRDGYAYITGNMFNTLLPVDMRDPLHPHYERMINLEGAAVTRFSCPTHYSGFFRGDRLFVPCSKGLVETDVSDPAYVRRVALHEKARMIHQVLADQNRAARWLDGRLEFLDIAIPAEPKVVGAYPAQGKFEQKPISTVTLDKQTWILAAGPKNERIVTLLDTSDMTRPAKVSEFKAPSDAGSILPDKGYVFLSGSRSFYVVDWRRPEAPVQAAALDEKSFLGVWRYTYLEDQPRVSVVAGGRYGMDLSIETKDGHTVWLNSNASTYGVDVSDPARPKVVGAGPGFGESWWIRTDESEIVSIGSYRRGFIDISNPLKPRCLMEYWEGHPLEIGRPCQGEGGMYQTAANTIRKWTRDAKDGLFRCETNALLPVWFGPDTECRINHRPACLLSGDTTVRSDPIAVKPGETLVFKGQARAAEYPARLHMFDISRFQDNARVSDIALSFKPACTNSAFASLAHARSDGQVYGLEQTLTVPTNCIEMVVEATVKGYAWLADLRVLRGSDNLLKNGDFNQPPDERGIPPGWDVVRHAAGVSAMSDADEEAFYLLFGRELYIYDLKKKGKLPVARIAVQVHPTSDSPVNVYVRREGARKVAYVITYQGVVTVDVTDPYRPAKLGVISIPWFSGSNQYGSFWRNLFVVSQGYGSSPWTEGFYIVDVADPARPVQRGFVAGRRHSGTVCHNGYVILGDYNQGMQIWDISNPDRPELVTDQGFVRCSQIWSIEYHGNHVLRNEVGGLELWEAPVRPQAPEGKVNVLLE